MTLVDNDLVVRMEMYLDEQTAEAVATGKVGWYHGRDAPNYLCDGLDPATFPKKEVPMKFWRSDHSIAWEWYIRAKKNGNVNGPPKKHLVVSMPTVRFLEHCLKGNIVIYSERFTCAFKKPVNAKYYPDLNYVLTDDVEIPGHLASDF